MTNLTKSQEKIINAVYQILQRATQLQQENRNIHELTGIRYALGEIENQFPHLFTSDRELGGSVNRPCSRYGTKQNHGG